jgi:integrase/recombinase XerD
VVVKLTTYLGHIKPESTCWCIEAVPELLKLASDRVAGAATG